MSDVKPKATLQQVLWNARKGKHWTQEMASLALGWTFYRYRRIELGYEHPSLEEIGQLAKVLGLSKRVLTAASAATVLVRESLSGAQA